MDTLEIPRVVFIGGTGRSGTNITTEIMGLHTEVATLPFEYRFIIDPEGIIPFYDTYHIAWSPYMADHRLSTLHNFLNAMNGENFLERALGKISTSLSKTGLSITPRRYHGWNLNLHIPHFRELCDELIDSLIDFEYSGSWPGTKGYSINPKIKYSSPKTSEEFDLIIRRFLHNSINNLLDFQRKKVYFEDNTWNILYAQELLYLFPNSKIVHVYRDPRDVVTSLIKQRWSPETLEQSLVFYSNLMSKWLCIRKNVPKERVMELKLESLIDNPQATMENICKFSSLSLETKMLEYPLSNQQTGRWKRDLTKEEQVLVNNRLNFFIDTLGYDVS